MTLPPDPRSGDPNRMTSTHTDGGAAGDQPGFDEWVILELLGHRRLAGRLTEQQIAGASFLRLDIPGASPDDPGATQLYSPASVYAITPTTEEVARRVAARSRPAPVQRWELPPAPDRPAVPDADDEDDDFEVSR